MSWAICRLKFLPKQLLPSLSLELAFIGGQSTTVISSCPWWGLILTNQLSSRGTDTYLPLKKRFFLPHWVHLERISILVPSRSVTSVWSLVFLIFIFFFNPGSTHNLPAIRALFPFPTVRNRALVCAPRSRAPPLRPLGLIRSFIVVRVFFQHLN